MKKKILIFIITYHASFRIITVLNKIKKINIKKDDFKIDPTNGEIYCWLHRDWRLRMKQWEPYHDKIYNEGSDHDASIKMVENQKTIGIRLLKEWNPNKTFKLKSGKSYNWPDWELETNEDGYFIVGKITNPYLVKYPGPTGEKVEVGALLPLNCSKQPAKVVLIINKTNKNASPRRRAIIASVVSISHQSYGFV